MTQVAATCAKLALDGLVIVGNHDTLTDAARLDAHLPNTKVIVAPASISDDIDHQYLQGVIGYDSCAKVYS
jgi:6-phosphofructokinase